MVKKPTVRSLQKELKTVRELNDAIRASERALIIENNKLRNELKQKIDDKMLSERQKLCNSLGQMIEATSKAIMFIVAKEAV
jgi:hypothetical protein